MEALTLTVPQSVTDYRISILKLDWDSARIHVVLKDTQGDKIVATYSGTDATNLMIALNKANLSVTSLQRRVLERLVADGKIALGAVTGTPD